MKYVCELCGTVYSEEAGDISHGISAGTAYEDLPEHYECPGCGSGKEALDPFAPKAPARPRQDDQSFWQEAKYSADKAESER